MLELALNIRFLLQVQAQKQAERAELRRREAEQTAAELGARNGAAKQRISLLEAELELAQSALRQAEAFLPDAGTPSIDLQVGFWIGISASNFDMLI